MATSLKLDYSLKNKVQYLAELKQRTAHWVMSEAIRQYVEREEAQENFKAEALASWEHFQETGLHVTGEEVKAWLQTWGTDEEQEAPECHV